MTEPVDPMTRPGEVVGWPLLKLSYRTDPEATAALLPPGLTPGANPHVYLSVYCYPVLGEPEFGVSTKIEADWNGMSGLYSLGIGIDQEAAIFISKEKNGQPKFPCDITYFRMGDRVEARCTHQGYTFLEFAGDVSGLAELSGEDVEDNEWWVKYSRAIGGAEGEYDFPPHVVRVRSVTQEIRREVVEGEIRLGASPWDPIAELLPMREQLSAALVTSKHSAREITNAGPLDAEAFWPHADTIGGSRWPGLNGGPR